MEIKHPKLYQWDLNRKIELVLADGESVDEVHFYNPYGLNAMKLKVVESNGKLSVDIPNILLQSTNQIHFFMVSKFQTIEEFKIEVAPKQKSPDYVYTETEIMNYETLKEMMEEINLKAGYYKPQISSDGFLSWIPSNPNLPEIPAFYVKGKDGKDGRDGKNGLPGRDGKDGRDGMQGVQGPPGPQGLKGDAGSVEFKVVTELPTENIDESIMYLLKTDGEDNNKFLEYIYVDGSWECVGSATVDVDLSEYMKIPYNIYSGNYVVLYNGTDKKTVGITLSQVIPEPSKIVMTTQQGTVRTNEPIDDLDSVNKKYADNKTNYRKVYESNLTENTTKLNITTDINGNSLKLRKCKIVIEADTTNGVYTNEIVRINTNLDDGDGGTRSRICFISNSLPKTDGKFGKSFVNIDVVDGEAWSECWGNTNLSALNYAETNSMGSPQFNLGVPLMNDYIDFIGLEPNDSTGFHIGTRIIIYGIDA